MILLHVLHITVNRIQTLQWMNLSAVSTHVVRCLWRIQPPAGVNFSLLSGEIINPVCSLTPCGFFFFLDWDFRTDCGRFHWPLRDLSCVLFETGCVEANCSSVTGVMGRNSVTGGGALISSSFSMSEWGKRSLWSISRDALTRCWLRLFSGPDAVTSSCLLSCTDEAVVLLLFSD